MNAIMSTYIAAGALLVALSVPLIQRRIPPNPWYGFRVRRTLEDPEVWYPVNEYAGRRLLWVGVGAIVAPLVLRRWPGLGLDGYATACLAITMVALAICVAQSFCYLQDLAGR